MIKALGKSQMQFISNKMGPGPRCPANKLLILKLSAEIGVWFRGPVHTFTLHHRNQVEVVDQAGEKAAAASLVAALAVVAATKLKNYCRSRRC